MTSPREFFVGISDDILEYPPMSDSTSTAPLDMESAYREALRAVSETDLATEWESAEPTRGDHPDLEPDTTEDARPAINRRVEPQQIIEAALFVGGIELSGDKLAGLLKGEYTADSVAPLIAGLNRRYASQGRPYEVACEEGLYRLALREEFEPVRRRVYGMEPKEIKLSQEALEVLSLIAYRQPISREGIEEAREGNAGGVLRQLVRRQLVAIERDGERAGYVTTNRFLEVFGLASLAELPRAERLEYK